MWFQDLLCTEWLDYVEEPMKYQALRPHFFSVVGGWRVLGVGGVGVGHGWVCVWVGGGRVGHGMGGGGVGGIGVGHGVCVCVGGWMVVGWVMGWVVVGGVGLGVVVLWVPIHPPSWGHQMPPMLFFDNLVKKLDQIVKK